jgi:hypothetical protein
MTVVSGELGEEAHRTALFFFPVPAIRRTVGLRAKSIDLCDGTKKEAPGSNFGRIDQRKHIASVGHPLVHSNVAMINASAPPLGPRMCAFRRVCGRPCEACPSGFFGANAKLGVLLDGALLASRSAPDYVQSGGSTTNGTFGLTARPNGIEPAPSGRVSSSHESASGAIPATERDRHHGACLVQRDAETGQGPYDPLRFAHQHDGRVGPV